MRSSAWLALVTLLSLGAVGLLGCASEDARGADASVEASASRDATADAPPFKDGRSEGSGDGADEGARDTGPVGDASGHDGASATDGRADDDGGGGLDSTVPGCASGVVCGGHCMPASDIHHCGSCTNDCAGLPNVVAASLACVNGACSYTCAPGFVACGDAGAAAGCPTDLSQPTTCGSCTQSCFGDSGTPNCAPASGAGDGGTFACTGACPLEAPTLCGEQCVDLMTNVDHCGDCVYGGCFTRVANAHVTCVAGTCGIGCNAGYSLCNGACVDETGDVANCGGCGVTCGTHQVCRAGGCVCPLTCSGACVDGDTDPANCGACGHDCLGGACSAGACQPITLATGQIMPMCMAMNATGVYWTNNGTVMPGPGNGSVMGVALDGTHLTTLATGDSPYGIAVDAQYAYWTDADDSILWRSPLDGGGVDGGTKMQLYAGTYPANQVRGVALAGGLVYWGDDGDGAFAAGAGIFAVPPTGGGNPMPITLSGTNTRHAGVACQIGVDAKNLYYPAYFPVGIDSVPLGGGTPTMISSVPSNLGDGWGVAVGPQSVFFDEYGKSVLYSVPLGGGTPTMFVTSPGYPVGMVVYDDRLFWADGSGTIRSVPVQGGPQVIHANGQPGPTEVTVDARAIYWINHGGSVMKVAR